MAYNMFNDVLAFHRKFELPSEKYPAFPNQEILTFRKKFLKEEVEEFEEAIKNDDLVKAFDALIDTVYVALGTAALMNLPWQEGWRIVHEANMKKVRARKPSDSKRGTTFDVIKPPNWTAPDMMLKAILLEYEYKLRTEPAFTTNKDDDE